MTWIILLILLGLLLFVAELILPGITIAAVGSFLCLVGSVAWAFTEYGSYAGSIVLAATVVALLILTALFLRPSTWNRLSLKTNIDSRVQPVEIRHEVAVGTRGTTLTRLAPMGNVLIEGNVYEAKSLDSYIDPRREVEVIGYENNNIIVRPA